MQYSGVTVINESGAQVPSRRGLLGLLAAGVLAPLLPGQSESAAARRHPKRNKRDKRRKRRRQGQKPPAAQTTASCIAGETNGLGTVTGPMRIAQTFTPSVSGVVTSAELKIHKLEGSLGDYLLHLAPVDNFGVPTNEVLAAASVANPSVPSEIATVTFTFPVPAQITAGIPLALVLTRAGSDIIIWHAVPGDRCGGLSFISETQTAPFAVFATEFDFVFTLFVRA